MGLVLRIRPFIALPRDWITYAEWRALGCDAKEFARRNIEGPDDLWEAFEDSGGFVSMVESGGYSLDDERRCNHCGERKPVLAFHLAGKYGRFRQPCRDCYNALQRGRRDAHAAAS